VRDGIANAVLRGPTPLLCSNYFPADWTAAAFYSANVGSNPTGESNIATGGRYAASYAAHRGFESRSRFQMTGASGALIALRTQTGSALDCLCASSPTAEAANLKSATVMGSNPSWRTTPQ
jgi:hypothetical protein